MDVLNNMLSPISITFIVIIVGYYIGQIKFFNISLNLSGVLIAAVFIGWMIAEITPLRRMVDIAEYQFNMKYFSTFGTALFVSSIGITTGNAIDLRKRKDAKAAVVGSLMATSAFVVMKVISFIDKDTTDSKLLGSLCGALTTTPGLSAACERNDAVLEEIVLGYGCTYLFGVVATVLFAQIATRKTYITYEDTKKETTDHKNKFALSGLIQIATVIVLGRMIGSVEILSFSLGNSGGMLCSGIIISQLIKKVFPERKLPSEVLVAFKSMGLVLFFVGNGITTGMQVSNGVDVKIITYGALMTTIPIVLGMILHKWFFAEGLDASTIAGGMTSTPAIGVIIEKHKNISLSRYVFAYFGALITTIITIRTIEP